MDHGQVRITAPCTLDWKKMTPADGGRFCGDCKKVVRNLSALSEAEARALLETAGEGELCVRYVYDHAGRVFFAGERAEPALLPPSFLHRARRFAVVAALPLATQACGAVSSPWAAADSTELPEDKQQQEYREAMGGVSASDLPRYADDDAGADASTGDAAAQDAGTD